MKTYEASEQMIKQLENNFVYHAPKPEFEQNVKYEILRMNAKKLAYEIVTLTPPSREQALALTNLEQAIFWANAAIARNE